METFPIHALSRPYTAGSPCRVVFDSGVASMTLGDGVVRTRDALGQALIAHEVELHGLSSADNTILEDFYAAHRADTFWWADPLSYVTYECRYDPMSPPRISPRADMPRYYDAVIRLLPVVPTASVATLVGHWKMNDDAASTDVADATGNGHTGTASHNTEDLSVAGRVSTALEFITASSRYVSVPDAADLRLADGGTICMWVKWDGTYTPSGGASPRLIAKQPYWHLIQTSVTGDLIFFTQTGVGEGTTSDAALSSGNWRHIAVVLCAASATRRIYVDGSDATSLAGDGSMPTDASATLYIGARTNTSGFFGGVLDDVRIYKRPLSQKEIQAIYNSGSGTEDAIVA